MQPNSNKNTNVVTMFVPLSLRRPPPLPPLLPTLPKSMYRDKHNVVVFNFKVFAQGLRLAVTSRLAFYVALYVGTVRRGAPTITGPSAFRGIGPFLGTFIIVTAAVVTVVGSGGRRFVPARFSAHRFGTSAASTPFMAFMPVRLNARFTYIGFLRRGGVAIAALGHGAYRLYINKNFNLKFTGNLCTVFTL